MATAFSTAEKAVKSKRERFSRAPTNPIKVTAAPAPSAIKPKRSAGRHGVKTLEVCQQIIEVVRTGLPLKFAAASVGVSAEALRLWREKDPKFGQEIEMARMASVKERWELIQKAARGNGDTPGDWKAAAWSIERTWPQEFGRPEVQLNHIHQTAITTHNSLAISFEVAKNLESRAAPVRRKVEALFASHANSSSFKQLEEAPGAFALPLEPVKPAAAVAEMKAPRVTLPAGKLPPAWWAQLVKGNNQREIERETAIKICRTILEDVFGKGRAQASIVEFDSEAPILLRDLHAKLEGLCGQRGWDALVKRGKSRK
jgi:hypothetical protein